MNRFLLTLMVVSACSGTTLTLVTSGGAGGGAPDAGTMSSSSTGATMATTSSSSTSGTSGAAICLVSLPPGQPCQCSAVGAKALACGAEVPTCCSGDVPCNINPDGGTLTCAAALEAHGWCCSGPAW